MTGDDIFVIGFDKSGETINGDPSDFIAHYEKVPGNHKFLRLVSRYPVTKSDKTCQIWNQKWWSLGKNLGKNGVDLPKKWQGCQIWNQKWQVKSLKLCDFWSKIPYFYLILP